jgi:hypothetical protein
MIGVMDQHSFNFTQRSLALTAGQSVAAFLATSPQLAPAIYSRLREIRIPWADQEFLLNYPDHLHLVILLSEEIPETVVVVPVLMRLGQLSPRFVLRILRDSDDLSGLNRLVDDLDLVGALQEVPLPQLLVFDEEWQLQCQWGPHPQEADAYLDRWFEQHPTYETLAESDDPAAQTHYTALLEQLTHEMRVWYNSGLNRACSQEICALLAGLLEETPDDDET